MKSPKVLSFCLLFICLMLSSCEKEALSILPGDWKVLDDPGGLERGSITFNADGTGKVDGVSIFLTLGDQVRGEANLTWEVLPGEGDTKGEILRVVVEGVSRTSGHDYSIKVKNKNRIKLAAPGFFLPEIDKVLVR